MSRSGLSVLEVLVVLVAILCLIALFLPALQSVRQTGGPILCQDHLHNLAIALHNYEDLHKTLPPGWMSQVPHGSNWGWGALLLPHVEQKPLYDVLGVERPSTLAEALSNVKPIEEKEWPSVYYSINVFRCPKDSASEANTAMPFVDSNGARHELALANYVGNHGPDWSTTPLTLRGVFGENSHVTFPDITDGTSNVIFIGERSWNLSDPHATTQCDAAVILGVSGDGTRTFERYTLGIGRPGINSARIGPGGRPGCSDGFASHHPGGVNVALGDGKVTFLSNDIDQTVLDRLLDKADGEQVKVP